MAERLEDAPAIQLTEARPEDEPDRLAGPVHPQGGDEKQDEDPEEDRQEDPRDALDSLLDAEVDDRDRGNAKPERQAKLQTAIGRLLTEQIAHRGTLRESTDHPARGLGEVKERPARDHRVVAEQKKSAEHAPKANAAPTPGPWPL